mgnify:CR=1 FL=1
MSSIAIERLNANNFSIIFNATARSLITTTPTDYLYGLKMKLLLIFLVSLMALLTIAGNLLVIIAFIRESSIRTYSNHFILNLSIADLLIGLIWYVFDLIAFLAFVFNLIRHSCLVKKNVKEVRLRFSCFFKLKSFNCLLDYIFIYCSTLVFHYMPTNS